MRSKTKESSPAADAEKQPEVKVVVTDVDQEGGEQGEASASATVATEESSAPTAAAGADEQPVTALSELPFQLQIQYIGMDGSKSLRVISKSQPVTRDRELAERGVVDGIAGKRSAS